MPLSHKTKKTRCYFYIWIIKKCQVKFRAFKYLSPILIYVAAFNAFTSTGWMVWMPLIYGFIFIPLVEVFIHPDPRNMSAAEEEVARKDKIYDYLLYLIVLFQYAALFWFLYNINEEGISKIDIAGRIAAMGLLCGVFGINVGHELGHRVNKFEQTLAKALLLTSLYMHFFTEHNKGHHKRVATPEDPSSARYGEPIYIFYFRTIVFSYLSAWHIATDELKKKNKPFYSRFNEMLQFHFIQLALLVIIYFSFGGAATLYFMIAAFIGILLLETVNYIEHYGLQRKTTTQGKYERTMPEHSWNSNHIVGRLMLFELSRHSDHHYMASRKYQVLRHHDNSPQMPTGYPGMMLLSLLPPVWFFVMNRRIKKLKLTQAI